MSFQFCKKNTFCISLFSHKDRWEKMTQRFHHLQLDVTRFQASTENDIYDVVFSHYLSTLQKCCAHSHIRLWKLLLSSNEDFFFIMEDDACFNKKWMEQLQSFFHDGQIKEWDALFLNASEPFSSKNKWYLCQEQYLCGGYILSKQGARHLLEMFHDCYFAADWMTTRLQTKNHCYSFFPWLIIQEGKDSTIGSGVELDHEKVIRCLAEISYSIQENYFL